LCIFRDMSVSGDVESIVHCMLHYFFDAVMVVMQVLRPFVYNPFYRVGQLK